MTEIQERQQTMAEKLKKRSEGLLEKKQMEEVCVILIDVSGSMNGMCENNQTKLENVKQSIMYLRSPGSYVGYGVVAFSNNAYNICPITTNFAVVITSCDSLQVHDMTNYFRGVEASLKMIEERSALKYRIILMSDGHNNTETSQLMGAIDKAVRSNVIIDTVGFGTECDERLLKDIAQRTGGIYQKALSPLQLAAAYQRLNFAVRYLEHKNGDSTINL